MELTQTQYEKVKGFIARQPTLTENAARIRRLAFDTAIKTHFGFSRWEETAEKRGYAGITLTTPTAKSPAKLEIIWTDDGINGYPLKIGSEAITRLRNYLEALDDR